MKKTSLIFVCVLLLTIFLSSFVFSEGSKPSVILDIWGLDNEESKSKIRNYLGGYLRSMGYVEVVDKTYIYKIIVGVMKITQRNNLQHVGYLYAVNVVDIKEVLMDYEMYSGGKSEEDIRDRCNTIIVNFDKSVLEYSQKIIHKKLENIRKFIHNDKLQNNGQK